MLTRSALLILLLPSVALADAPPLVAAPAPVKQQWTTTAIEDLRKHMKLSDLPRQDARVALSAYLCDSEAGGAASEGRARGLDELARAGADLPRARATAGAVALRSRLEVKEASAALRRLGLHRLPCSAPAVRDLRRCIVGDGTCRLSEAYAAAQDEAGDRAYAELMRRTDEE